jgi:flavodoxin
MKIAIVYDSWYGNTAQIARAIGHGLAREVQLYSLKENAHPDVSGADCLIAGSPTHGGRPTPAMAEFLDSLPAVALDSKPVAAFDTRVGMRWVKFFGFAGRHIADKLDLLGGYRMAVPQGFYVRGKEGPLREGEIERATAWGRELAEALQLYAA